MPAETPENATYVGVGDPNTPALPLPDDADDPDMVPGVDFPIREEDPNEEPAAKPFEIGDELVQDGLPTDDAAIQGLAAADDEDAELASIFNQHPSQDEEDDLVIDWDPTRGLPAEGIHPNCRLANVEKGATSDKSKNPGTPSIVWYVTIDKSNQTVKKTVPMVNGGGIERKNIEFARIFGVEPKATQVRGTTQYSLKLSELKKCVGMPCSAKVRHFNDMATLDDILPPSPAAAVSDLPAYPDEEPF